MRSLYTYISIVFILLFAFATPFVAEAKNKFTVVIDPGHGGGDIGTPHRKCKQDEKVIALNVALKLGKLIEQNNPDIKVVYTRKKDIYPSLPDRTQIAKNAKGDLFISIHVNAAPDASARGFETYVFGVSGEKGKREDEQKRLKERMEEERENLDINGKLVNFDTDIDIETKILCQAQREKHNKQSLEFANSVQKALINGIKKTSYAKSINDRGVRPKNLFVLCYSPMPAVLIELGYMSNLAEEKFITTDAAQDNFAQSIYSAVTSYKKNWDKRQLSNIGTVEYEEEPAMPIVEKPAKQETKPAEAKPTKEEAKPAKEEAKPSAKNSNDVYWRIQFYISDTELKPNAKQLKGLSPVQYYKDGKVYKYTYGNTTSKTQMNKDLQTVKKLFKDAFPVKFDSEGNKQK